MRAFWTDDALRSTSQADWELLPNEVQTIRAARARAPEWDLAGGSSRTAVRHARLASRADDIVESIVPSWGHSG